MSKIVHRLFRRKRTYFSVVALLFFLYAYTYLEMRIPLADIGSPASVDLHLSMINETDCGEWPFAGVPSTSFSDGQDPDSAAYYSFDLTGTTVPTAHSPQWKQASARSSCSSGVIRPAS